VKSHHRSSGFNCTTRYDYSKNACVPVSINEDVLKNILLEMLRVQAAVFSDFNPANAQKPIDNSELRSVQTELDRASAFLKGLYESLISGDITDTEYRELKQSIAAVCIHKRIYSSGKLIKRWDMTFSKVVLMRRKPTALQI